MPPWPAATSAAAKTRSLYSAVNVRRFASTTTSGSGRAGLPAARASGVAPAPLRSASLRSASLRSAEATPDEEPTTTTLGFTLILLLALLTKSSQENCLSYVGTEGTKSSSEVTASSAVSLAVFSSPRSFRENRTFYQQGEMANEAARVGIESGDLDLAYQLYKKGRDLGLQEPDIKPDRKDLWEFRWEHAQARIAARRGDKAEAQKHVAAAKAILDRGVIDKSQAQFFPYLTGYVALYTGRLQDRARRLAEGQSERSVHTMSDRPGVRKTG